MTVIRDEDPQFFCVFLPAQYTIDQPTTQTFPYRTLPFKTKSPSAKDSIANYLADFLRVS